VEIPLDLVDLATQQWEKFMFDEQWNFQLILKDSWCNFGVITLIKIFLIYQ